MRFAQNKSDIAISVCRSAIGDSQAAHPLGRSHRPTRDSASAGITTCVAVRAQIMHTRTHACILFWIRSAEKPNWFCADSMRGTPDFFPLS